jgi:hypothetical protein
MHGERHLTYSELNEEVERFARGLMSTGIGKGDRVIVWMPNSIEWNIVFPALAKIGAITVPVSTRYRSYEMGYIIERSGAVAVIMTDASLGIPFLDMIAKMVPEAASSAPGHIRSERFPSLRNLILSGERGLAGSYSMEDIDGAASATDPEDLAERNSQVAFLRKTVLSEHAAPDVTPVSEQSHPARDAEVPCYQPQGNPRRGPGMGPEFQDLVAGIFADSHYFPVFSLWIRFPGLETRSHLTAPTAN